MREENAMSDMTMRFLKKLRKDMLQAIGAKERGEWWPEKEGERKTKELFQILKEQEKKIEELEKEVEKRRHNCFIGVNDQVEYVEDQLKSKQLTVERLEKENEHLKNSLGAFKGAKILDGGEILELREESKRLKNEITALKEIVKQPMAHSKIFVDSLEKKIEESEDEIAKLQEENRILVKGYCCYKDSP